MANRRNSGDPIDTTMMARNWCTPPGISTFFPLSGRKSTIAASGMVTKSAQEKTGGGAGTNQAAASD
jgi:hypothetical protein